MIKQLAHICIHTNDLKKTLSFYRDALDLEIGFEFEKQGQPFGYYIKLGNTTFIEVFLGDPGEVGNIQHVAIQVTNLDALIHRIREHGYEVSDKTLGSDNSWQAWVTDPNGIKIEFHQYTDKSFQIVGGKCPVTW